MAQRGATGDCSLQTFTSTLHSTASLNTVLHRTTLHFNSLCCTIRVDNPETVINIFFFSLKIVKLEDVSSLQAKFVCENLEFCFSDNL